MLYLIISFIIGGIVMLFTLSIIRIRTLSDKDYEILKLKYYINRFLKGEISQEEFEKQIKEE